MTADKYGKSNRMTKNIRALGIFLIFLAIALSGCGKKNPEIPVRPWIENEYSNLADSILLQKVDQNDTLAVITLGWRYLQNKKRDKAASLFKDFNKYYDKASPDLTYLSAFAFSKSKQDSLALKYIQPLLKNKSYPEAKYLAAESYLNIKDYDAAIAMYKKLRKYDKDAIDDSILRCKAEQGDTLSAITFARKMLNLNKPISAAPYYGRIVSLSRNVSPPTWSFEAGKAFYMGNNFTRAAVYLENADADTSCADLSFWLGKAYYMLQVYDSATSKFYQAMEMGDSSNSLVYLLMMSYSGANDLEKTLEICNLGISLYPEDERFYFAPAKHFFENKEYEKLKDLAESGLKYSSSYKLESYNIAAHIMLGDEDKVDSLIDKLILDHRFEAGALSEAAKLFETGLHREDIVARIKAGDMQSKYPMTINFLFWYQKLRENGHSDSARILLKQWLDGDTVQDRLEFMRDLYQRDYPDK